MSTISPPVRGKTWVFQVTALCIVLGMVLALALKTQRQAASQGVPTSGPALQSAYRILKQQNQQLEKDLAETRIQMEKLASRRISADTAMQQMLDESKMLAGTVPVRGPGVVVMLQDSPKRPVDARQEIIQDYIVHDRDIRDVVNELFAAGAEAISVNGQRLVASSSIRCVGPVVLVNTTQVGAPFVIKAIGNPETLESALKVPGGIYDDLDAWDMITITKQRDIHIPAYSGSTRFNYAKRE